MTQCDTLIRQARIVDGTGNPWFYGDVALSGDKIAEIAPSGRFPLEQAGEVVEAAGLVVCPGFIDILSHSILPLMVDGRSLSKITQGVTTEIMGEAWTPAPYSDVEGELLHEPLLKLIPDWYQQMKGWTRLGHWLEAMIEAGVSPNIGTFLGGGTLRELGKGMALGPADEQEQATMRRIMAEAMEDGAFGVSHALIYPPSAYVDTAEIVDTCRVVAEYGGLYITHIRSEADGLIAGLEEAIEIGRQAQVPVEIYHLKAAGKRNWGKLGRVIELIEQARAQGLDITADMYPYPAAGTGLASVLPPWVAADGKFYDNLRDPAMRAKIQAEALNPSGDWEAMVELCGPEGVMPVGFQQPENRQYAGQRLSDIARLRGQSWVEAAIDLLLSEGQRISTIYFLMDETNLKRQLQLPWLSIGTDAGGLDPSWAKALGPYHPRAYGSYPRILGKYVREEGVLTLEEAIRKMSSAVAQRLGLRDRGLLRPGFYADVVIFDPAAIGDRATFAEPHQLSVGVQEVWINGQRVLKQGQHTGARPGRIVEGPGRAR